MGCDIHAYIEFAKSSDFWHSFGGRISNRNYLMFGILAGVRDEDVKLFEPKGMPEGPLSFTVSDDYWLSVAPKEHPEYAELDNWTSEESAKKWRDSWGSKVIYREDQSIKLVSNPDWHSHSWLLVDQYRRALCRYTEIAEERGYEPVVPPVFSAMYAAMAALEDAGCMVRLVFWFDN